jgi:hypothetical protein
MARDLHVEEYEINTYYSGPTIGLKWHIPFLSKYSNPYIVIQGAKEKFKANTFIFGYGKSYYQNTEEEFVGYSNIKTKENDN